jgi:excisionase family DNA binding protein
MSTDAVRWLKVREAADRARCGPKTIYRAVQSGQLRAARVGGRRELRFLASWIDCWLAGEELELPGNDLGAGRRTSSPLAAGPTTRSNAGWPQARNAIAPDTQPARRFCERRRAQKGEPLGPINHDIKRRKPWHMRANGGYGRA